MSKASEILGMNAREQFYSRLNSTQAKSVCKSKLATKLLMQSRGIPTAEFYGIFALPEDVNGFDWQSLQKNFVIKPTNGHAGKGVVAFKTQHPTKANTWIDAIGREWSLDDIKLHCYDILEGQYSTHGSQHNVIIEERIPIHPKLLKYTYKGTPDVRVVVYNNVPVMAKLRLPTKESEGRANVTQGAIMTGIDIATGVTTYAVAHKTQMIKYLPGTKKKLNGILIPQWNRALKISVEATMAANLMYCGVDLFFHEEKGPMVVELNAFPGLSIQVANKAGLRRRLSRVEDLNVLNAEHGVRIGQALFAESFSDKITAEDGLTIISANETVKIQAENRRSIETLALINTGRYRSAISSKLASEIGLIDVDDLLWFQQESGEGKVPVVEVKFKLKNKTISTAMVVSKHLDKSSQKIHIGRKDLGSFMVRTS
ncbi:MAG: sugar-transfer associated ATP-grasp domain-containing protein [Patescibacteria group bacterium]